MCAIGSGQVGPDGLPAPPSGFDLIDDCARIGRIASVMDENLSARLGKREGGGASDTARGACNEGGFPSNKLMIYSFFKVNRSVGRI